MNIILYTIVRDISCHLMNIIFDTVIFLSIEFLQMLRCFQILHFPCSLDPAPLWLDSRDFLVIKIRKRKIFPSNNKSFPYIIITSHKIMQAQINRQIMSIILFWQNIFHLINNKDPAGSVICRRIYFYLFYDIHVWKNRIFQIKVCSTNIIGMSHILLQLFR